MTTTNGQILRQMRLSAGWTQEQLANLIHVSKRTVQRWEAGDRHCPDLILMLVERLIREARNVEGTGEV